MDGGKGEQVGEGGELLSFYGGDSILLYSILFCNAFVTFRNCIVTLSLRFVTLSLRFVTDKRGGNRLNQ